MVECEVLLIVSEELLDSEYVSSLSTFSPIFTGSEARIHAGEPAAEAIEALVRSRFKVVTKQMAKGSGSDEFFHAVTASVLNDRLVMRPRITLVESVARPARYDIELGITVDTAGLSVRETPTGSGTGTASVYTRAAIRKAADDALSAAVAAVASRFPTCR
ncbi:MAG TPA: hypothetical protein VLS47_00310 [Gallionella sp.]|nr:hypothetical protein [Gallionella sp.]